MEISNIASGCLLSSHGKKQCPLQNCAGSNKVTSELLFVKSHNARTSEHQTEINLKHMKETFLCTIGSESLRFITIRGDGGGQCCQAPRRVGQTHGQQTLKEVLAELYRELPSGVPATTALAAEARRYRCWPCSSWTGSQGLPA